MERYGNLEVRAAESRYFPHVCEHREKRLMSVPQSLKEGDLQSWDTDHSGDTARMALVHLEDTVMQRESWECNHPPQSRFLRVVPKEQLTTKQKVRLPSSSLVTLEFLVVRT